MSNESRAKNEAVQKTKSQMIPKPKMIRKEHVVIDAETSAVVFTGEEKGKPSINAAKRWVRGKKFPQYHLQKE